MRRFVVLAALLGLTACGGEPLPEEMQALESSQEAVPAQVAAPSEQVSEESLCGNTWECRCAQYKTSATCNAVSGCFWWNGCQPTYE